MYKFHINILSEEIEYSVIMIDQNNLDILEEACSIFLNGNYGYISLDTETSLTHLKPHSEPPTIMQFGADRYVYILDPRIISEERTPLFLHLMSSSVPKVGFDIKIDVTKLGYLNIEVMNTIDLQVIAELLGEKNLGMDYLSQKYIGAGKDSSSNHNWDHLTPKMIKYAGKDIILSLYSYEILLEKYIAYMKPIFNQLLDPEIEYDTFDLAVIAVNHSPHRRTNNVQIRSLIHLTKPLVRFILADESTEKNIDPYSNPIQYTPLNINEYRINDDNRPYVERFLYFQEEQKNRLFTPEENTEINLLIGKFKSKCKDTVTCYDLDPYIVSIIPKGVQGSEIKSFQELLSDIVKREKTIAGLKDRPLVGPEKNIYQTNIQALNKRYNDLNKRLERYHLTKTDIEQYLTY